MQDSGMSNEATEGEVSVNALDLLVVIVENRKWLLLVPLAAGLLAGAISLTFPNVYTAWTVVMPPQQQQSAGLAALQSIGNLAGLAGAGAGIKSPLDQYVSLLSSNTISDRIVAQYKLVDVYKVPSVSDARDVLLENVRVIPGKKDGLLTIEVDDTDPQRAAAIANDYVPQLLRFTSELAITEAQQRRLFFEKQLQQNKEKLIEAQRSLQQSALSQSVMRLEPKAASDAYASLRAQVAVAEVRLQSMRAFMTEGSAEFRQAQSTLWALQNQLKKYEASEQPGAGAEYIDKYREFKYQETLFELLSKQYELAKLDESRDAALVQVVDPATPPERKSKPKRFLIVGIAMLASTFILLLGLFTQEGWRLVRSSNKNKATIKRLYASLGRLSS